MKIQNTKSHRRGSGTTRRQVLAGLGSTALLLSSGAPAFAKKSTQVKYASRYPQGAPMTVAAGWSAKHVTPPSALYGSNGLRFGPDGQLYIAQAFGSQISALNLKNNALTTVCPIGGDIVAPDDLAFDHQGNLYITEVYDGRLSRRTTAGKIEMVYPDMPNVNGVTVYGDRIFVDECRPGGRLQEVFADGRTPRLLVDNLPLPNAPSVGPDKWIYYPLVGTNEIWKVSIDGGQPQRVCGDLGSPTAVKFDYKGVLHTIEGHTGAVLQIDITNGQKRKIASLRPGLDNFEIGRDGHIYTSSFMEGGICDAAPDGTQTMRVPRGFTGPFGLTVSDNGTLYAADGVCISSLTANGEVGLVAQLLEHGYPGFVRDIVAVGDKFVVTTAAGKVVTFDPATHTSTEHATGLNELCGIAVTKNGALIVAEAGAGRVLSINTGTTTVLASGLNRPMGVCLDDDDSVFVTESGAGRVLHLAGKQTTVTDGLQRPEGIARVGRTVIVSDCGSQQILSVSIDDKKSTVVATNVPLGAPPGITPKPLKGIAGFMPGPLTFFGGMAADAAGTVYVSANGEGSIIAFQKA